MELVRRDFLKPDLIMIPIGGHFVMDPVDAAYAGRARHDHHPGLPDQPGRHAQLLGPGARRGYRRAAPRPGRDAPVLAFQRSYFTGRQTAQGRYPAAIAVRSSAKNTRCSTYPPRAMARRAAGQSSRP
jgi:hypothetical protein